MVTSFKCLERLISATDDDWPEVVRNLAWVKTVCRRMSHILSREGVMPQVSGFFFKAMIQVVMLFVAETWVFTPYMGKAMVGFQTHVARRMMLQLPQWKMDGAWKYTSAETAREAAGFLKME